MKTRIIFEDDYLLVCYKPGGLAVQSAEIMQTDMVRELKNYIFSETNERNPYLGVIHRLDQPAEGLLVFGKTKKVSAELERQLGEGILRKKYVAVLKGIFEKKSGTAVDYLRKNGKESRAEIVSRDVRGAKYAELEYKILREKGDTSLAEIQIKTGRFHQIRAQMAHMGHPIMGDRKYGGGIRSDQGLCLCACYLEFIHPADKDTGEKRSRHFWVTPENTGFKIYLEELEDYGKTGEIDH